MFNKMITLFLELKTGPSYLLLGGETLTMCWEWESLVESQVACTSHILRGQKSVSQSAPCPFIAI